MSEGDSKGDELSRGPPDGRQDFDFSLVMSTSDVVNCLDVFRKYILLHKIALMASCEHLLNLSHPTT